MIRRLVYATSATIVVLILLIAVVGSAAAQPPRSNEDLVQGIAWLKSSTGCDLAELLAASKEWASLSIRRSYLDGQHPLFMSYTSRLRYEADLVDNKDRAEQRWRAAVEACR